MKLNEYMAKLDEMYQYHTENGEEKSMDKLKFLGDYVFDFTTYDDNITRAFSGLMLEVIACILNKTTFEYQAKSENHYVNYLIMVNMPFLKDKLEWGSSIRGAWFDYYKGDGYQVLGEYLPASDLEKFLKAVSKWMGA